MEGEAGWASFVAIRACVEADESREITSRSTRMAETITELDEAIQQEHEDCLAHAAAETEPLHAALRQHDEFLARQACDFLGVIADF